MKFELILFTALFFFSFENFGQVEEVNIQQRDTTLFLSHYGIVGQLDSCSTINKKNDRILTECYNKETQIIKARILIKDNFSRKWNKKIRKTTWVENEKKSQKYIAREITKKNSPDSTTELIDICLLISRPCDVAQNKYGKNLKLISGVLIKNPDRKENAKREFKKGSSNLISVKLYDHLQFSEEDNDLALIFDYRYVFSVPEKMFIDKFENIKVFNKELLSEIQVEYSSYSSRLGITQII